MRHCSNCGTALDPEGRFCGGCGFDNGDPGQSEPDSLNERARRKIPRWIIVVGVLVMLVCCVVTIGGFTMVRMIEGLDLSDIEGLVDSRDSPFVPTLQPVSSHTQIYDVWIDHNAEFEGQVFMIFHVEHEVLQADTTAAAVVAFMWLKDGSPMLSYDPDYDVAGQATVLDLADVTYNPSTYWEDYQLWIPYTALEAGEDHFATVELQDAETGRILDSWVTEPFSVMP